MVLIVVESYWGAGLSVGLTVLLKRGSKRIEWLGLVYHYGSTVIFFSWVWISSCRCVWAGPLVGVLVLNRKRTLS